MFPSERVEQLLLRATQGVGRHGAHDRQRLREPRRRPKQSPRVLRQQGQRSGAQESIARLGEDAGALLQCPVLRKKPACAALLLLAQRVAVRAAQQRHAVLKGPQQIDCKLRSFRARYRHHRPLGREPPATESERLVEVQTRRPRPCAARLRDWPRRATVTCGTPHARRMRAASTSASSPARRTRRTQAGAPHHALLAPGARRHALSRAADPFATSRAP